MSALAATLPAREDQASGPEIHRALPTRVGHDSQLAYYPVQFGVTPAYPKAVKALVLGILGLFIPGLAPFAVWFGHKSLTVIDASGGRWGGRSDAKAGFVLGLIGMLMMALFVGFNLFPLAAFLMPS